MIGVAREPALVLEARLGPRDDPLVALLDAAYQKLAPPPGAEELPGLIVAGDGSSVGQRRIFERSLEVGRALPPRFIPHRLSNGPASQLAIRYQHTGRVLTFADGRASLFRALAFTVASLETGLAPSRWITLCGEVDDFDAERVRGAAIAFETADAARPFARLRSGAPAGSATAPSDSRSLLFSIAQAAGWPSEQVFRDPEREAASGGSIRAEFVRD